MKKAVFWTLLLIHGPALRAMDAQSLVTTANTAITTLLKYVRFLLSPAPAPSSDQPTEDSEIWEDLNTDPEVVIFFQEKIDKEWDDLYKDRSVIEFLIKRFNDRHKKLTATRQQLINTAATSLAKAQKALPANRQHYITTNLDGLDAPKIQDALELACIRYSSYMERVSEHFPEDYECQTLRANLKKCGWNAEDDYQRIYPSLGYTSTQGIKTSYEDVIRRLAQKNQEAQAQEDKQAIKCFRQIEYIMSDPFRHEAFNAYVRGGRAGVKKLCLDGSTLKDPFEVRNVLAEARGEINDLDKQLKAVTEYKSKLTTHLQTLPID